MDKTEIKKEFIEAKMKAKRTHLESKGIKWGIEEWNGYREGLEDMYKLNSKED